MIGKQRIWLRYLWSFVRKSVKVCYVKMQSKRRMDGVKSVVAIYAVRILSVGAVFGSVPYCFLIYSQVSSGGGLRAISLCKVIGDFFLQM